MVCPLFVWQNRVIFSGIHACFGPSDSALAVDPYGNIFFPGQVGSQSGLFRIDQGTNSPTLIDPNHMFVGLAFMPGGSLIGITDPGISTMVPTPGGVFRVDPQTGSETAIFTGASGTLDGPGNTALAVNASGDIFFTGQVDSQSGLFCIAHASNVPTLIDPNHNFAGLAFTPGGSLIGITDPGISTMVPTPGSVISIDPVSGLETPIFTGASGTSDGPSGSALAVDSNGDIYLTGQVDSQFGLFRLDPGSEVPTPIESGQTIVGLAAEQALKLGNPAPVGSLIGLTPGNSGPPPGISGTTTPGSVISIDPQTGIETPIFTGASETDDGPWGSNALAVDANGDIFFTGQVDSQLGLFRINQGSNVPTLIDSDQNIIGLASRRAAASSGLLLATVVPRLASSGPPPQAVSLALTPKQALRPLSSRGPPERRMGPGGLMP